MENFFIDMHVHTNYSYEKHANLSVEKTLDYYQQLAERKDKRIIIRVTDHENFFGGVKAVEHFTENREKYPNLFVIPGIECNVNLDNLIKYEDVEYETNGAYPHSDEKFKYVFKRAHVAASPILKDYDSFLKWKNNIGLQTFSLLCHLTLTEQVEKENYQKVLVTVNTGDQILAGLAAIKNSLNIDIPLEIFKNCINSNLTHNEIISKFYRNCAKYLINSNHKLPTKTFDELLSLVKNITKDVTTYENKFLTQAQNGYPRLKTVNGANYYQNSDKMLSVEELKIYHKLTKLKSVQKHKKFIVTTTQNIKVNTGSQIIAAKNLVKKMLGIEIPFSEYHICTQKGLSHTERVNKFYEQTANYLKENYKAYKVVDIQNIISQIKNITHTVMQQKPSMIDNANKFDKIDFIEFVKMVNEAGGTVDFVHPNSVLSFHKNTLIPAEYFDGIDLNSFKALLATKNGEETLEEQRERKQLKYKLIAEIMGKISNGEAVNTDEISAIDSFGIIKLLLAVNALRHHNILDEGKMIGAEIPKNSIYNDTALNLLLDIYDNFNILPSYGQDYHMHELHQLMCDYKDKKIVTKNNKLMWVDGRYVQNMIEYYKNINAIENDKNRSLKELEEYYGEHADHTKYRKQLHEDGTYTKFLQRVDLIVQSGYVDYLMGKEVNFKNSSLFTIKGGSILEDLDNEL